MQADVFAGWTERYESEPKGMRAGWVNILGPDPVFPRDVTFAFPGGRYKKTPERTGDYLTMLEQNAPKGDAWVAWSPVGQYEAPGMDRIFADIDSPDLENALQRARRYEDWCMRNFDVRPPAIFTAGKGFHLQFTMDYVEGTGTAFSDAFLGLVQGSGATLDPQPLKHRYAAPRVPYTMRLGSIAVAGHPMFIVPVDLTWDLRTILRASKDIEILPFEIPHSDVLAGLLQPEVTKAMEAKDKAQTLPEHVRKGIHEDLITAAIAFSENVGWKLVDANGKPDGRRRVLSSLYVPALMVQTDGDRDQVIDACMAWLDKAGAKRRDYKRFLESTMKDCVLRDGTLRHPVGLRRFFAESPELRVRE